MTVLLRLPARRSVAACRLRLGSVSGFPLACLNIRMPCADPSHRQELVGLPKFLHASLPACHGLSTPADLPTLALLQSGVLVLPSVNVQTLGVRNSHISKLYQHFRARGHPCGLQDSLSTLRPGCSQCLFVTLLSPLRTGRKTRYGWLARPYPTGAFTLQEAPSFLGARTILSSSAGMPNGRRRPSDLEIHARLLGFARKRPLCTRSWRSARRSSSPSLYSSHVTSSTPGAASRLCASKASRRSSSLTWCSRLVNRCVGSLLAASRILAKPLDVVSCPCVQVTVVCPEFPLAGCLFSTDSASGWPHVLG